MTKRSVQPVLSAALLFVAALMVAACGDDDNSSPPSTTEGEGEGEGSEGEGEGEGEGDQCIAGDCEYACNGDTVCMEACPLCEEPDECTNCIESCGGVGTCVTNCYPIPCAAEGEGEGEGQPDPLDAYQWFAGTWNCEAGDICAEHPTATVSLGWWDEALGTEIYGFIANDALFHFKWNDQTKKFETREESAIDVLTGNADPTTKIVHLVQDVDYGSGPLHLEFTYRKQE